MKNSRYFYQGKIVKGKKIGRTIGYPTINFDDPSIMDKQKKGVYVCLVNIDEKIYEGVLFFGPRLVMGETKDTLEIFVFGLDKDIYEKKVSFCLVEYLRKPKMFASFEKLKEQLQKDCKDAREIFAQYTPR